MQTSTPNTPKASPRAPRVRLTRKERKAEKRTARQAVADANARLNAKARRELAERHVTDYLPSQELDLDAMCRRDSLLDSLSTTSGDVFPLVDAYVDWLQGGTDDDAARQARRAHWRRTNTARALCGEHDRCEFGDLTCWTNRPGAEAAHISCSGCIFSFPQPTAPDRSLLDAYGRLETEYARERRSQLLSRVHGLMRRYV